jgi:hypothetical protein
MDIVKKVFPILGVIITIILTVTFRTIPKGKTWENYNILYVKTDTMPANTQNILRDCGIMEYVSIENQRVPIMLSRNSIEETMLKLNLSSAENRYLYDRQNYFYDSKGEYTLFYVPDSYEKQLDQAVQSLTKAGAQAGIDSTLSYMWLIPIVVLALALILTAFSKNKLFFFVTAILPCVYIFCNAFYASAISVIILLLALFMFSNIINRKGALNKIIAGNVFVIAAVIISIIAAFSVSLVSGIFYLILIAGTMCSVLAAQNLNQLRNSKYEFKPVMIRSAKRVSIYGGKTNVILPVVLVSALVIFAYFILGSFHIGGTKNKDNLLLPGKTSVADTKLPLMEDYFRWNWNVRIAPYKSLNDNGEYDENHVVFPEFVEEDGIISQRNLTMYYNQSFKQEVYDNIEQLDFYSIEAVIKQQGTDFLAGYTKAASYNVSLFSIIMMIMCFCMLLFIYFSAIIGKGGKR